MCLALDCAQLAKERVPLTEWRSDRLWVWLALALLVVLFARRNRSAARPNAETKRERDSATARQFWLAALSFFYLYAAVYGGTHCLALLVGPGSVSGRSFGESFWFVLASYELLLCLAIWTVNALGPAASQVEAVSHARLACGIALAHYLLQLVSTQFDNYASFWEVGCDKRVTRLHEHVACVFIAYGFGSAADLRSSAA